VLISHNEGSCQYIGINTHRSQADALYAKQFNCQPLKTLPYKWPLGLDLLWSAYLHAKEGRILRFFNGLISPLPATFEQKLLGISGIDTIDPRNIEAVLGTQFTGVFPGLRIWREER
jgi:hypothetical protein